MSRSREDSLAWMDEGTAMVLDALASFSEEEFVRPSALPGWSRKQLVAHISANADALGNLVHWAATGEVTPMYESMEQRNADIVAGATRSAADLTRACEASAARLRTSMDALSASQWDVEVQTAQGRTIPASETPWMRSREVMIHAVDLDTGLHFSDLPQGFLVALCDDIVEKRSKGPGPALSLEVTDGSSGWVIDGDGSPVSVTGPTWAIASYLAGRGEHDIRGEAPALPAWL